VLCLKKSRIPPLIFYSCTYARTKKSRVPICSRFLLCLLLLSPVFGAYPPPPTGGGAGGDVGRRRRPPRRRAR
jgi:hypothetical protein